MKRVNVKTILADPSQRRELMVRCIIATQAREGIVTTQEQAEAAYDKVQKERRAAWDQETPHFGETAPHRYENGQCVYCGRPKSYKPRKGSAK